MQTLSFIPRNSRLLQGHFQHVILPPATVTEITLSRMTAALAAIFGPRLCWRCMTSIKYYNIWTSTQYNIINNNTNIKDQLEVEFVTIARYMCIHINIPKSKEFKLKVII